MLVRPPVPSPAPVVGGGWGEPGLLEGGLAMRIPKVPKSIGALVCLWHKVRHKVNTACGRICCPRQGSFGVGGRLSMEGEAELRPQLLQALWFGSGTRSGTSSTRPEAAFVAPRAFGWQLAISGSGLVGDGLFWEAGRVEIYFLHTKIAERG